MGAGVSFVAGMPLAGQLSPLVWHALDSNPNVLKLLCAELGVPIGHAKAIVSDDPTKISRAFRLIKSDETAYRSFKQSFCHLNDCRTAMASQPHTALARLVHAGRVIEVISFNWDTLLEYAFSQRFGFEINGQDHRLWKPHGDCRNPKMEWVLPHEEGIVPAALLAHLANLASVRPRVLLIIGYSERDAAVVDKLIAPLASRWRVFRVSPSATGEGAINLPAGVALEQLADQLVTTPDVPGWSVVTFENQRGIEAAIAGERLGPRDVNACPRLPHFDAALEKLSLLDAVEIAGDSGSGKSITVWQLAHEFHRRGWQVLRLDLAQKPTVAAIEALKAQTWKSIAVADDSQVFPTQLIERLRDLAGENLKVILGTTDPRGEQREAVRAAAKVAVETLANHFLSRRASILPIVQQFDSQVGDSFLHTRIERRINDAAKEKSPWQFAYVLRGGTRRVRNLLSEARDFEQADLLLVLIAARQLATLDAGSSVTDLLAAAQKIGRTETWVHSTLEVLSRQRAILISDVVRCLHLMSAGSIVEASLEIRDGQDYLDLLAVLQGTLRNSSLPLRGISWLLHHFWHGHYEAVVLDEIKAELISRCMKARTHVGIRDACFVIERLLGRRDQAVIAQVIANHELLRTWVIGADVTDAYAVGRVMNGLRNRAPAQLAGLLEGIDAKLFAEKIGATSPASGYVWGDFMGCLCVRKGETWRAAVAAHFPREAIRRAVGGVSPTQCEELPDYIQGFAGFDFDFALELFEIAAPILASALRQNSIRTFHALFDKSHWLLGEGLFFDEKPTKRQRAISKRIFEGLDPREVVSGIITCPFGEWENYARLLAWVRRAHPAKHRAIVQAMDWAALDHVVADKVEKPGREFSLLLTNMVTDFKSGEPAGAWLLKHADKMKEIGSRIVILSPQTAHAVFRNGGKINLEIDHGGWLMDAFAIARIAGLDENAAEQVVKANVAHFAKGIAELPLPEGMPELLTLIAGSPELLEQIFSSVDVSRAKERWPIALLDHQSNERKAARAVLSFISKHNNSELGQLAGRLMRQVRYRKRSVAQIE